MKELQFHRVRVDDDRVNAWWLEQAENSHLDLQAGKEVIRGIVRAF